VPDALAEQVLPATTVRIDVGGKPNGTGFFVSTTHVVTCAHVLDPYLQLSVEARPSLTFEGLNGASYTMVGEPKVARADDLALVQLNQANTSTPAALLTDMYDLDDRLFAFGYPEGKSNGDPVTLEVEGTGGGESRLIKFKYGQVQPGFSGSPLLNRRTGAVCGIIKRTRDKRQDLGGYGIRTATLFAAFEEVPRLNQAAHKADHRWMDKLTTEQRRLVQPEAVDLQWLEYVISVSQEDEQWRVTACSDGSQLASVVVDLNTVRKKVPRLFRAWKAQGRIDDTEQAELLGEVLYCAIAPGLVGGRLEELALADKRSVHVSLHFDYDMDIDLVHLPWEQLYVESSIKVSLATFSTLTLTRVVESAPDPDPPAPGPDASVLLITSPALDSPRSLAAVARDVEAHITSLDGLQVDEGGGELGREAVEAAARRGITVLHYVGVGRYEHPSDKLLLAGAEPGETELLDGDQFAAMLFSAPPRLAILQTLADGETTTAEVPADPTMLALRLIGAGVAAVVAFPYPLRADDAVKGSKKLYSELATGSPIRVAVQRARLSVGHWFRPALYLRRPSDLRVRSSAGR
jgi:hypothetical protein